MQFGVRVPQILGSAEQTTGSCFITIAEPMLSSQIVLGGLCLGIADDWAIVVRKRFADTVTELTQEAQDMVDRWCREERAVHQFSLDQGKPHSHKDCTHCVLENSV